MPWILLHQTWQIYPPIKQRCLEYCYTKLGRSTPLNQAQMPWIPLHHTWHIYPPQLSIDALNTITPTLADLPPKIKHKCLEYHYTKLGRSTPQSTKHRCLEDHYTKPGRSTPHLSIDHWMSYWEICNLISIRNLISRNMSISYWEIQR